MSKIDTYHTLAKDAGNRLRAYILSVASGATGVFFLALTKEDTNIFSKLEKWYLAVALSSFFCTIIICLVELKIDANRFYNLAKECEKPEKKQNWSKNEKYKKIRLYLIYASYILMAIGILATITFLLLKLNLSDFK